MDRKLIAERAYMDEIVQSVVGSTIDDKFITDAMSKITLTSKTRFRCRLTAVAGSDKLIKESVEYNGMLLLFLAQECTDERIRHIMRVINDGH